MCRCGVPGKQDGEDALNMEKHGLLPLEPGRMSASTTQYRHQSMGFHAAAACRTAAVRRARQKEEFQISICWWSLCCFAALAVPKYYSETPIDASSAVAVRGSLCIPTPCAQREGGHNALEKFAACFDHGTLIKTLLFSEVRKVIDAIGAHRIGYLVTDNAAK